jgi:hypothetical protein
MDAEDVHKDADFPQWPRHQLMVPNLFDPDHFAIRRRNDEFLTLRRISFRITEKPDDKSGKKQQHKCGPAVRIKESDEGKKGADNDEDIPLSCDEAVVSLAHV